MVVSFLSGHSGLISKKDISFIFSNIEKLMYFFDAFSPHFQFFQFLKVFFENHVF